MECVFMKNNEKNSFIKNIFIKTEKINSLFLFLIIVIIFAIVIILQACVLPKNEYKVEPNYEEVKYYDWVNPYVRVFTSYVDENEEITPKYRVIACFFGNTSANRIIDFKGDFLFITEVAALNLSQICSRNSFATGPYSFHCSCSF